MRVPEAADPASTGRRPVEDRVRRQPRAVPLHVRNFLDCVKSRQEPISDLESGHRVATVCHLANLSLRLGRKLRWDAEKEEIRGDAEANQWLERAYRPPWDGELKAVLR